MTAKKAPACIVTDVTAVYVTAGNPDVRAVENVSLTIAQGEVLGIAGESGCGKSTLAAVVSMTAKPPLYARGGQVTVGDTTIDLTATTSVPQDWHGEKVALLPQRAMNSLNPTMRVRDFVVDVMRAHEVAVSPSEAVELARARFELLSLPPRVLDSYPHQLSGGMRQRVVAVVSTLLDPTLLIADEPSSALDVSSQKQLVLLLQQLLERDFIGCIAFITHDLPMLSNLAHRIAIMYAGKVVEIGTTHDIVDNPKHPYTSALIGSTLDPDPRVRGRQLEGLPGAPPDLRYPPSGCRFHPRCPYAMDICVTDEPPIVGDSERFAACWLVAEQAGHPSVQKAEQ